MAKGQRMMIGLVCSVCKRQNYMSSKNKTNTPDKLVLKKYCRWCKRVTDHKESTKFK
ncbi:50S ribosomal protein L33 [Candidatus Shapirobacteria bacterium CG07_land_8_20_14_0_80_39_18]|uniref:Large ribosomal subunit protein bL33 n=1 Tax=Candidatus Shapirobacteria bacterium CG07_land_8_20_14_0_80_39_18 TaxID=1974882 RepID=A0A2M6YS58_9BACT|nr:MAG: 50S ribosomal protein L33 [Candidatus Shapirobacteria bacterium CG07_land_8_20_14_0_80_39_18]